MRAFRIRLPACAGAALLALGCAAHAGPPATMAFQTHAAFFSSETGQKAALDPQVFVAAAGAPAATGPQNIRRVAGLRNAFTHDAATLPILTGNGQPMAMTLGQWLGAHGDVVLDAQPDGREKISVVLDGLVPGGHYSLFENHFDQSPIGFTPLDGTGVANSFVAAADGKAVVTVYSPTTLTHDNAVLLVYHSDHQTHGTSRGDIGLDAHHQLIARP